MAERLQARKARHRKARWNKSHGRDSHGRLLGALPQNNIVTNQEPGTGKFIRGGREPIVRFRGIVSDELRRRLVAYGAHQTAKYRMSSYTNFPALSTLDYALPPGTRENPAEYEIEQILRALLRTHVLPYVEAHWVEYYTNMAHLLNNPRVHFRMAFIRYSGDASQKKQPPHTDATDTPTILIGLIEECSMNSTETERTSFFRCQADGRPSRAKGRGGVYYGPGDVVVMLPGVTHFVTVPECIRVREIMIIFLDKEP